MEAKGQVTAEKYAADISSIREAQLRIGPFVHRTPVVSSETLDAIAGRKLLFKCECFQKGRLSQEVSRDALGEEFKGYVCKIMGGCDKQGYPMKQGVLATVGPVSCSKKGLRAFVDMEGAP
ncbi:hypothetical protein RHGRI_019856 [Rhododendron griersonianum]|uniref:Uncharacterized protein n=1 Tax=Rhododendron griersonianum TaxID=479676 RepID=A0AAV6JIJ3_9ERIC|nr:hypothetical protein RHGRI_019856 [Rhododendron griersonianum]